jgi:hypothetical protein
MTDECDELALLCASLLQLRDLAEQAGVADELTQLVEDLRRGEELGRRRIELLRRMGIAAGFPRQPFTRLPGLGSGRPVAEVYGCPVARCSRQWVRPPGDPLARCALYDRQLSLAATPRS